MAVLMGLPLFPAGAAPKLRIYQVDDNSRMMRKVQVEGYDMASNALWRLERRLHLNGTAGFSGAEGIGQTAAPWTGELLGFGAGSVNATVSEVPMAPPVVPIASGGGPRPSWTYVRAAIRRLVDGRTAVRWPTGGSASPSAAEVTAIFSAAQMNLSDPWPPYNRDALGVGFIAGPASDPLPLCVGFSSFPDPGAPNPTASTLSGTDVTIRNFLLAHAAAIRGELFRQPNMDPPAPPSPVTPDQRSFFLLRTETPAPLNGVGVPAGIAAQFGAQNRLIISEICLLNTADPNHGLVGGEVADWVEILNPTASIINAGVYRITDKDNNTGWHPLPNVDLGPGQSLVMNCTEDGWEYLSENDSGNPLLAYTAPFGLKEDFSETVRLGKVGAGGVVSQVHFMKVPAGAFPGRLPAGISYGIRSNAAGTGIETGFFATPTRGNDLMDGALNQGWLSSGAVPEPVVEDAASPVNSPLPAHGRLFSSGSISVRLKCADPAATITYTLNGSEPNGLSPIYTPGASLTFAGTTVLRARAFRTGKISSGVTTRTYIHTPSVISQVWPVGGPGATAIGSPMNQPQVWNAYATTSPVRASAPSPGGILSQFTALPSVFLTWHADTPSYHVGSKAEMPVHVEYSDPAAPAATYAYETGVLQDSGNHSNGGYLPLPFPSGKFSWHLIFKKAFNLHGGSTFAGPVIPAGSPNAGTSAIFPGCKVTSFHRLLLRNPSSDSWAGGGEGVGGSDAHYFNDAYLKETQRALSGGTVLVPRRRWTHVFVNGYYWGMYDLQEHIDEDMISSHLAAETPGVKPKDIEYVQFEDSTELEDDAAKIWNDVVVKAQIASNNPNDEDVWNGVVDVLDIFSYIDYVIIMSVVGKDDHKNREIRAWKNPLDKKCRLIVWDGDEVGVGSPGNSYIWPGLNPDVTYDLLPHEHLKSHPQYRVVFDQRLRAQLGGALLQSSINARYQAAANEFRKGLECEAMRWGNMGLLNAWGPAVDYFRDPSGSFKIGAARQGVMHLCRQSRLLTDIQPPMISIGTPNAQGTPVTITRVPALGASLAKGVIYYRYGWNSKDPADYESPVYVDPGINTVSFTDSSNLAYTVYARTWALDLDGVANWSALSTYP